MKGFLNLFGMSVGGWIGWALRRAGFLLHRVHCERSGNRRRALLHTARGQTASALKMDPIGLEWSAQVEAGSRHPMGDRGSGS